jgi:hypothetical protein
MFTSASAVSTVLAVDVLMGSFSEANHHPRHVVTNQRLLIETSTRPKFERTF